MHILNSRPYSLSHPNILTAIDPNTRKHLLIKLLRLHQPTTSESTSAKNHAVTCEIEACEKVSTANINGLVKCEIVQVKVPHNDEPNITVSRWIAIKMKRYVSSLTDIPQLPECMLYEGFILTLNALKQLHNLNLVHMDLKPDNLFVDDHLQWDLGDFGSSREIGSTVWTFSETFNPYSIPITATVIPAMDLVLLCVTIAVELKKDDWKELRGMGNNVQENLVLKRLEMIKDVKFKKEVVDLFKTNYQIVNAHLEATK